MGYNGVGIPSRCSQLSSPGRAGRMRGPLLGVLTVLVIMLAPSDDREEEEREVRAFWVFGAGPGVLYRQRRAGPRGKGSEGPQGGVERNKYR